MFTFILGLTVGISTGTAVVYFLFLRPKVRKPNEWMSVIHENDDRIIQLNKPKAVTKLTNRERTVTI